MPEERTPFFCAGHHPLARYLTANLPRAASQDVMLGRALQCRANSRVRQAPIPASRRKTKPVPATIPDTPATPSSGVTSSPADTLHQR